MTEAQMVDKVSRFFTEMEKDLGAEGAAQFLSAIIAGTGVFVGRHFKAEALDDIGRRFGKRVAETAKELKQMECAHQLHIVIVKKEK